MDIIFATKNKNKMKEIRLIMENTPFNIISMEDTGINIDIIEDGDTFEANAIKKASQISKLTGKIVLADDSGLEIDFLNKAPGVYSARYMSEDTSYDIKNAKILELMKDVPLEKRTARFVAVIAAAIPDSENTTITERATLEGTISFEIKGQGGFGYDPILFVPEFNMTTAEMGIEQKNKISHRGKALNQMKSRLISFFNIN